jgi:hypothetical protein
MWNIDCKLNKKGNHSILEINSSFEKDGIVLNWGKEFNLHSILWLTNGNYVDYESFNNSLLHSKKNFSIKNSLLFIQVKSIESDKEYIINLPFKNISNENKEKIYIEKRKFNSIIEENINMNSMEEDNIYDEFSQLYYENNKKEQKV